MGIGFSFFKAPKHRVYNYQPLYYDEKKEDMQERFDKLHEEEKGKEREYKPGKAIRGKLKKAVYESRRQPGSPLLTRFIVLLSLLGLVVVLYYVAKSMGYFFV